MSKDNYNYKEHWNNVYENTQQEKLGWYEENPEPSLGLIKKHASLNSKIINIGSGTSNLIDELLKANFESLIATDLSNVALQKLEARLNKYPNKVEYIVDDLKNPINLKKIDLVDVWHDRAVLHFLTETEDQNTYFELLNSKLKSGGFAILAAFHLDGAEKCSRLPVVRYNSEMLDKKTGDNFKLIESMEYNFVNPNGDDRPYIYTVFQKQ